MTSTEFNELIATHAKALLFPLGFKKAGAHFYIRHSPNLMVFYKKTFRGMFGGFCLACTHDFLPGTTDAKGKLKIPVYLEDYPFSIPLTALKEQYAKYKSVTDFSYDTNFLTREVLPTSQLTRKNPMDIITLGNLQNDQQKAEDYVKSSIDIVIADGMKLFSEYSPAISYLAVTRHRNVDNTTLNNHKSELERYLTDNKIAIPKRFKLF